MIQGYITQVAKDQCRALVQTEFGDLVSFRILDGSIIDVGDPIVGALDHQGENLILDLKRRDGVLVFIENGRRLFASAGRGADVRHSRQAERLVQKLSA